MQLCPREGSGKTSDRGNRRCGEIRERSYWCSQATVQETGGTRSMIRVSCERGTTLRERGRGCASILRERGRGCARSVDNSRAPSSFVRISAENVYVLTKPSFLQILHTGKHDGKFYLLAGRGVVRGNLDDERVAHSSEIRRT